MIHALAHLKPGYGKAIEKLKEMIDQGRDPEDVRPGATASQVSSVSGPSLADMVLAHCEHNGDYVELNQLERNSVSF